MDYQAKVEWLSPKRVMKLYKGQKAVYGSRRLFIIGIGSNGIDILARCKDIAENRYGSDNTKIRFLGIGLKSQLDEAQVNGSVLEADERLEIDPEEAIYSYLNDPSKLTAEMKDWFDEGLFNYTQNTPVYGIKKRQCARLALFHYFDKIRTLLGQAVKAFSNSKSTIQVVFTGNLGDAFFGGMVIDLAYLVKAFLSPDKSPITVSAAMLAADTALQQGLDGRDLAIFYANTVVTKYELDKFQCKKKEYNQCFSPAYTFNSKKTPFSSCFINAAEENYELTVENTAMKIMTDSALLFEQDDDADRLLSYNMLSNATQHTFRYLCSGTALDEIPMGKIASYLTLKTVIMLNSRLKEHVATDLFNLYSSKVTPDEMLLALKGGDIPNIEYDEHLNPLFSPKSLKKGSKASFNYVMERLEKIAELCTKGSDVYMNKIYTEITDLCDKACRDNEKGPYYAEGLIKRCQSTLTKAIQKKKSQIEDAELDVSRDEHLVLEEWRRIHGVLGLFSSKDTSCYITRMKRFEEDKRICLTGGIVVEFYEKLYEKLETYYKEKICKMIRVFDETEKYFKNIAEHMSMVDNGFVRDAFDVSEKRVMEKLDRLVEQLPEQTVSTVFQKSRLLECAVDDNPKRFAAEACAISCICFRGLFTSSYDELCQAFGCDRTVARALEECMGRVCAVTPVADEQPLMRAVCPQNAQMEDIAGLRAVHNNLNSVWTNSSLLHTVIVQQVKGGVKLDHFKDYEQWENMRYAYVNDSLKKHGIRIFH